MWGVAAAVSKVGTFRWILAIGLMAVAAGPAATQGGAGLAPLKKLQPGLYKLRPLDDGGRATRSICVANPEALVQLEHRGLPCSQLVVGRAVDGVTVHYTCPAGGYGRTAIRVETARVANLDTQGISNNRPFAYRAEARRTGACPRR